MGELAPAQELREAAARIREVGAFVPHGPWHVELSNNPDHPGYPQQVCNPQATIVADTHNGPEWPPYHADYIAFWHPGRTELVAQMLDKWAWMVSSDADLIHRIGGDELLALARAINGGAA